MTNCMLRAEGAVEKRAQFDNYYMNDLDELLWYSHPACRARIDRTYAEFSSLGFALNTVEFLEGRLTANARISAGFDSSIIMEKIAYHRTAIRNLDRTIANARQHMSTQQIGLQIPMVVGITEPELTIKYRDIHRWCVSMLHTVITSHTE